MKHTVILKLYHAGVKSSSARAIDLDTVHMLRYLVQEICIILLYNKAICII